MRLVTLEYFFTSVLVSREGLVGLVFEAEFDLWTVLVVLVVVVVVLVVGFAEVGLVVGLAAVGFVVVGLVVGFAAVCLAPGLVTLIGLAVGLQRLVI